VKAPVTFRFGFRTAALCALASLPASCTKANDDDAKAEIAARAEYAKRMLIEEDAGRLLGVASSPDIMFEEGFSRVSYNPPDHWREHAFRWLGQNAHVRLRSHPGRAMRLHVQGWVNEEIVRTKAQISVFLDGEFLRAEGPFDNGHYWIEVDVPPSMLKRPWVDLNLRLNAVGFHWSDPPLLMVANVYNFSWTEVP
jgi:hypothetical protein